MAKKWIFKQEILISPKGPTVELRPHIDGRRQEFVLLSTNVGVTMSGDSPLLENRNALDSFARAMALAWKHHTSLKFEGKPYEAEPEETEAEVPTEVKPAEVSGHNEGV